MIAVMPDGHTDRWAGDLPVPPLVEPDPTTLDPKPAPWHSLEIEPDGSAVVTYLRGPGYRLHVVEVTGSPVDGLRVRVLIGREAGPVADGPVLAIGIAERARVRLPFRVS